jgi:hypothetical protein
MIRDLLAHASDCRTVRDLLRSHGTDHLAELYWYDLRLRDAVQPRGWAKVALWNAGRRRVDEIASNYGLANLYYAPPRGDGLRAAAPTVWHCANLESRPWWGRERDPVRSLLEANAAAIIAEYHGVARDLRTHPDNGSLTQRGRLTGLFLYGASGARNHALLARCPVTAKVLDTLPVCRTFGFAMFSGMEPHTHVAPHCGSSNLRLRYHLGIDVPEPHASWLRVGTERRSWAAGEVLAFDDSYEHEVEHAGERPRVVLVVDVWHPALSERDIAVLSQPVFERFGKAASAAAARAAVERD